MKRIAFVDGDSIAYDAGTANNIEEMKITVNYRMSNILEHTEADDYKLYLEEWRKPKENFRIELFDLSNEHRPEDKKGYKGNRKGKGKPALLDHAREFMLETWKATVVLTKESEDQAIIDAFSTPYIYPIICCIDKDLLQHPLEFYNYRTGATRILTREEATLNLWRQVCTGDLTDNIPGIPRCGKKMAEKSITCEEEARFQAARLYSKKGLSYEYFVEQFNLIYIRKEHHTRVIKPLTKAQYEELSNG